ncbi:hypothetical protein ILUMI_16362 [Ignelater luminosus]|uniref:Myotrophin n=1 Tax=Ignelater luminosus TaxID=2038154 RepID=A0A8K0CRE6_IGNLU|nr:hypothetical protein ILUMI_16362 [Ignelater luminosus]
MEISVMCLVFVDPAIFVMPPGWDVYGSNALLYAALEGSADAVKALLSRGSKIDVRSKDQKTPLIHAAKKGHLDTVKYLINKGVDIEAEDNAGNTALIWATWNNPAIVEFLLTKGANTKNVQEESQALL